MLGAASCHDRSCVNEWIEIATRYVVRSIEADVSTEKAILLRMNACHACGDVVRSADTSSCLRSRFGHERWPRRKRPLSLCVPYVLFSSRRHRAGEFANERRSAGQKKKKKNYFRLKKTVRCLSGKSILKNAIFLAGNTSETNAGHPRARLILHLLVRSVGNLIPAFLGTSATIINFHNVLP